MPRKSGPDEGFEAHYDRRMLVQALDVLLSDAAHLRFSDAYRYDVVDVTRQVLTNLSQHLQGEVAAAYAARDRRRLAATTARFHGLLADVDALLATRREFDFGRWLDGAAAWGTTPAERAQYRSNAAWLVTLWGPDASGRNEIFDYSWREWSGLIRGYYLPRWQQFHAYLAKTLETGEIYSDPPPLAKGRQTLVANGFYRELTAWELAFASTPVVPPPPPPAGDAVTLSRALLQKYRPDIRRAYAPGPPARTERPGAN